MSSADTKNKLPFFTIVMPTYNRANLIKRSIESVLNQTFDSWELIIVDDGGFDNTRDLVEQFQDARLHYYWKPNEERSRARNYGIIHARGKYINFLDSDDLHMPHHLETAKNTLSCNREIHVLHMSYVTINSSNDTECNKVILKTSDLLGALIYDNPLNCNAIFIRAEVLSEFAFLDSIDANIGEDWYLWLRLAARYSFYLSTEITTCIVNHTDRSIADIDPFRYERSYNVIISELKKDIILKQAIGSERFHMLISYQTLGIGLHFLINKIKSKRKAIKYIGISLIQNPSLVITKRFLICIKKLLT